jgi:chromate transporter
VAAAAIALVWTSTFAQVALIVAGALIGRLILPPIQGTMAGPGWRTVPRGVAIACLGLCVALLLGLPLLFGGGRGLPALFAAFFQSGALVFGGGHVVLPLLHTAVVEPGWVSDDQFLAGYGAAQAVPGPLFTIAAFLGAVAALPAGSALGGPLTGLGTGAPGNAAGLGGSLVGLIGIFLPGSLLIVGVLPFWDRLRRSPGVRRALAGTNAVVVGLLVAAFWNPIWVGSVRGPLDVLIAAAGLALLLTRRVPPIVVVALAALAGQLSAAG